MNNGIAGAYQRKEYMWSGAWIFLVVIAVQLAGIGGAVGATLMMEGLYRTIKNQTYTTVMKALYSVGYVVGSVVVAAAIFLCLSLLFNPH